jgi:hypothetical protein
MESPRSELELPDDVWCSILLLQDYFSLANLSIINQHFHRLVFNLFPNFCTVFTSFIQPTFFPTPCRWSFSIDYESDRAIDFESGLKHLQLTYRASHYQLEGEEYDLVYPPPLFRFNLSPRDNSRISTLESLPEIFTQINSALFGSQ